MQRRGPLLPIRWAMRGTGFPTWLGKGDPDGLTICLGSEGSDIVTCRLARSPQDRPLRMMDLLFSCECGSSDLEMCYTFKTLWAASVPTLRPVHDEVRNLEGNPNAIADAGAACDLSPYGCTQANLKYEPQRKETIGNELYPTIQAAVHRLQSSESRKSHLSL